MMQAREGQGNALAEGLLHAAGLLAHAPGCELYVVSRSPSDEDVVWVTEVWRSPADMDASVTVTGVPDAIERVGALLAAQPQLIETLPVGGHGLR